MFVVEVANYDNGGTSIYDQGNQLAASMVVQSRLVVLNHRVSCSNINTPDKVASALAHIRPALGRACLIVQSWVQ
jgi:hypothetical protein